MAPAGAKPAPKSEPVVAAAPVAAEPAVQAAAPAPAAEPVKPVATPAPEKKKGFFARLFGL
ncbi:hypothetical protein [Brevundimonas naejangsanensis]|uniref:hypothetical protein n=1 Tax=Brevundimonas naejangsanensis TaxID=588932 RepID=UPI0026F1175B|nr:hypothetical protein [Brevundimonas naejangsanensis]